MVRAETNESTDIGKTLEREKVNRPSHIFGGQAAVSRAQPGEQAVSREEAKRPLTQTSTGLASCDRCLSRHDKVAASLVETAGKRQCQAK